MDHSAGATLAATVEEQNARLLSLSGPGQGWRPESDAAIQAARRGTDAIASTLAAAVPGGSVEFGARAAGARLDSKEVEALLR